MPEKEMMSFVEILSNLEDLFGESLQPNLKSVRVVNLPEVVCLEITRVNSENDEVERVDLSAILAQHPMQTDDPLGMFLPDRSAFENGRLFLEELDPYSILMFAPIFQPWAERRICDW